MFYDGHLTKLHSAHIGTWHICKASSNINKTLERVLHSELSDSKLKFNMWQHKLIVIKIDVLYLFFYIITSLFFPSMESKIVLKSNFLL